MASVDEWYAQELRVNADSIRDYEHATYYAGTWQPQYEIWVQMLAGMYRGPGREAVAWDSALLYDMIYTQPVLYEFEHLSMPVLLMIGDKDTTAIGKALAPPEVRSTLGDYPGAGQGRRRPHAARPVDRVSRVGPRAADTGAGPLPRGPDERIASHTAAVNSPRNTAWCTAAVGRSRL